LEIEARLTLAWYDYAQIRRSYKGGKQQDKTQLDTMSIQLLPTTYLHITLFVNSFHAPRRQYMPFWLLKDA